MSEVARPTSLYLIRHGQAFTNVTPIIGGMRGDTGLTPLGVAQAERLRDRLVATGEIAADLFIASTFPRARQTAEIIAPAISRPLVFDDEVQEMRPGEADGLTLTAFVERYGRPDFEREPLRPLAPGGESWGSFMLRVASALGRLTREHAGKSIVVVCHGGVIEGSMMYFLGLNTLELPPVHLHPENTSITQWELHPSTDDVVEQRLRWRLRRYNDATHLHGLEG